jgi:hypothetical protein
MFATPPYVGEHVRKGDELGRARKAPLYRRTCAEGGMNLDVLSSDGHS